jgi:O-antigen ligase
MRLWPLSAAAPTAGRLAILFIAFVVPLVFCVQLEDGFEMTQSLCAWVACAFLSLLAWPYDWKGAWRSHGILYAAALGFLAVSAFSYLRLRGETPFYFPVQNYLWVLSALLFLVPVGLFTEKKRVQALLVLGGVLGSLYSFLQALGMDLAGWDTHFGGRSFSTLGNPIFWAGHLLVLLPLSIQLAVSSPGKKERTFWASCAILMLASLLTTKTRGAWLGFGVETAVLLWLNRRRAGIWKSLAVGFIFFLLALLFIPPLRERALSILDTHGQDAQGRYLLWDLALDQWKEKPWLGQGPGGYGSLFHRFQSLMARESPYLPYATSIHAHEEYLELLAERGMAGFLLGGMVLWILVMKRLKACQKGAFPVEGAELALLAGLAVHSLFNFPLSIVPTACALSLLFNPSWDGVPPRPQPASSLPREFTWVVWVLLLTLCGAALRVAAQDARLHRAIDLENAQRHEEALKELAFDPSSRTFHYLDPRVLRERALALVGLGRDREAARTLESIVAAYPDDADAYAMLCMVYGRQKDWARADQNGLQAVRIAPFHEQALNNLAVSAYLQDRRREAAGYLSRLEEAEKAWGQAEKAAEIHQKVEALLAADPRRFPRIKKRRNPH